MSFEGDAVLSHLFRSINAAATWGEFGHPAPRRERSVADEASFSTDKDLMLRRGKAMGAEFRGKGINVALSPMSESPFWSPRPSPKIRS